jgi:hypothetical protein
MIEELEDIVDGFPGAAKQTRCFAHILSLVAKSIVRLFDAPKKTNSGKTTPAEDLLMKLAKGIELEKLET